MSVARALAHARGANLAREDDGGGGGIARAATNPHMKGATLLLRATRARASLVGRGCQARERKSARARKEGGPLQLNRPLSPPPCSSSHLGLENGPAFAAHRLTLSPTSKPLGAASAAGRAASAHRRSARRCILAAFAVFARGGVRALGSPLLSCGLFWIGGRAGRAPRMCDRRM